MKLLKYGLAVIIVVLLIIIYKTATFTTWRLHNTGVKKYEKQKYAEAADAFKKASKISNDPIHLYNWLVSESKLVKKTIKELKNDSTIQQASYSSKFNQLKKQIPSHQTSLDSLLTVKDLPDNLNAKIYHLKSNFYLLTEDTLNAIANFSNAIISNTDFKPSLLELVKLNKDNETDLLKDSSRRLLLNISDDEEIQIEKNYKPF